MREFYILSLKWSREDHATWWAPNNSGYVSALDQAGRYTQEQIERSPGYYNNGDSTIAIPCADAEAAASRIVMLYALQPVIGHRLGRKIEESDECEQCGRSTTHNMGAKLIAAEAANAPTV